MQPRTLVAYRKDYEELERFAGAHSLPLGTPSEVAEAALQRINEAFLEGIHSSYGSKLLAAIRALRPDVASAGPSLLSRAVRAAAGFRKLAPGRSRLPLPWEVVAMICNRMVLNGQCDGARAVAVAFAGYLRPCDLLSLRVRQLIAPVLLHGGLAHWAIVLYPQQQEQRSKVGECDESILFDADGFKFLDRIFEDWVRTRHPDSPLLAMTHGQWGQAWRAACSQLRLDALGVPVLYQLRHGGAAHDILHGVRSTAAVKKRGRWGSDRSLNRYERAGRVAEQLHQLSKAMQQHAFECAGNIGGILSGTCPALPAPGGRRSSSSASAARGSQRR